MRESLAIHRRTLGESHPQVAFTMKNVAHFVFERGKLDDAEAMVKDVIQREEETVGRNHPQYARSLCLLGAIHGERNQFVQAEAAYRKAGNIIYKANGWTPEIGLIYNNLAHLYKDRGQLETAIAYYRKAEEVFQTTEGPDHVDVATALVNRAMCHGMLGDPLSALECYKLALPIRQRVYGRLSNDVAVVVGMSGLAYSRLHENEETLRKYAEAFAIYREMGFPKTDDCKVFLHNYSVWLKDMGDIERSLEIRRIAKSLEN